MDSWKIQVCFFKANMPIWFVPCEGIRAEHELGGLATAVVVASVAMGTVVTQDAMVSHHFHPPKLKPVRA